MSHVACSVYFPAWRFVATSPAVPDNICVAHSNLQGFHLMSNRMLGDAQGYFVGQADGNRKAPGGPIYRDRC